MAIDNQSMDISERVAGEYASGLSTEPFKTLVFHSPL